MSKKNKDKIKKVERKDTQTRQESKVKKGQKWSFSQSHPYEWMPKSKR